MTSPAGVGFVSNLRRQGGKQIDAGECGFSKDWKIEAGSEESEAQAGTTEFCTRARCYAITRR